MLAKMPVRIFREWMQYAEEEPWGEERADWRSAMIAHTMASIWRGKGQRRSRLSDFLPQFERRRKKKWTPKAGLNAMVNLAKLFGGEIRDERPDWKKQRDGKLF